MRRDGNRRRAVHERRAGERQTAGFEARNPRVAVERRTAVLQKSAVHFDGRVHRGKRAVRERELDTAIVDFNASTKRRYVNCVKRNHGRAEKFDRVRRGATGVRTVDAQIFERRCGTIAQLDRVATHGAHVGAIHRDRCQALSVDPDAVAIAVRADVADATAASVEATLLSDLISGGVGQRRVADVDVGCRDERRVFNGDGHQVIGERHVCDRHGAVECFDGGIEATHLQAAHRAVASELKASLVGRRFEGDGVGRNRRDRDVVGNLRADALAVDAVHVVACLDQNRLTRDHRVFCLANGLKRRRLSAVVAVEAIGDIDVDIEWCGRDRDRGH